MNKVKKARIKLFAKIDAHEDEVPCLTESPDLFDPDMHGNPYSRDYRNVANIAKAFCAECPARLECLDFGLKSYPTAMVWGGLTTGELSRVRRGNRK